jgi:arylsulfatase A-like enzyme
MLRDLLATGGFKLGLAVLIGVLGPMPTTAASPPNIVFIMADDLGWRDVGFMGAEFYETPHVDQLAAEGMIFTAAASGGPNCSPARACLMSGCYPPRHRIYTPGGMSKGNPAFMRLLVPARARKDPDLARRAAAGFPIANELDAGFVCIPEVLAEAGYRSARLGKWHLGPDTQGFGVSSADGRGGPEGSHYGDPDVAAQLTTRAVEFMGANRERPFFLYLSHWDVHLPHRARAGVVRRYAQKLAGLPPEKRDAFDPTYAAMIEAVDASVGRVTAKLDELGLADRTLVIFTSDNGGLRNVSQLDPLRGEKGSLFEAGLRVPCCMRWTGTIDAGSRCGEPITSVDFLPTFAALAGARLPAGQPTDGVALSPLLRGERIAERGIFWHFPLYLEGAGLTIERPGGKTYSWRGFPSTAIRRGRWKLIEFHETDEAALYDLEADPGEQRDRAAEEPELTAALRAELDAWQKATNAPVPTVPNPECTLAPQ